MAKKTILILSITVLTLLPGFGQSAFKNPVIPGFYPDPSICRVGDDYYLATSSFQFWPGIPVFHSKNLVDWTKIGYCITRKEQIDLSGVVASDGLWALNWQAFKYPKAWMGFPICPLCWDKMINSKRTNIFIGNFTNVLENKEFATDNGKVSGWM